MIPPSEVAMVVDAMERYGGSFVNALALAITRADSENLQKIRDTWPEEWEKYLYFAQHQMWDDIQKEREEKNGTRTD